MEAKNTIKQDAMKFPDDNEVTHYLCCKDKAYNRSNMVKGGLGLLTAREHSSAWQGAMVTGMEVAAINAGTQFAFPFLFSSAVGVGLSNLIHVT